MREFGGSSLICVSAFMRSTFSIPPVTTSPFSFIEATCFLSPISMTSLFFDSIAPAELPIAPAPRMKILLKTKPPLFPLISPCGYVIPNLFRLPPPFRKRVHHPYGPLLLKDPFPHQAVFLQNLELQGEGSRVCLDSPEKLVEAHLFTLHKLFKDSAAPSVAQSLAEPPHRAFFLGHILTWVMYGKPIYINI